MTRIYNFSSQIFSEKEVRDFKRRQEVIRLLRVGETWKKIREKTGAHLQTIALIAKRLKTLKEPKSKTSQTKKPNQAIFVFGQKNESL